jgi:hypothetical protein
MDAKFKVKTSYLGLSDGNFDNRDSNSFKISLSLQPKRYNSQLALCDSRIVF